MHEFDDFLGTFLGTFLETFPHIDWTRWLFPVNCSNEHAAFSVVSKADIWPVFQSAFDAGPQTFVRQQTFGYIGYQDRIADIRNARTDFLHSQVIRQISRTDDLNAVVENENTDRRVYEIVSVN